MFSGLLVFLFVKLSYYTTYFFFQKLDPFLTHFFCVLLNPWFEKIETLSKYIDVRLVPCLAEWIIS